MPRVTMFRRASSGASAGRRAELVERLRLDQREVVPAPIGIGERAALLEVAVALEPAAGPRHGPVDLDIAASASAAMTIGLDRAAGAGGAATEGSHSATSAGSDQVAELDGVERLGPAQGLHANPGGAPNATAPTTAHAVRRPATSPTMVRASRRSQDQRWARARARAAEPVAPDRPRLRMAARPGPELSHVELKDRRQARSDGCCMRPLDPGGPAGSITQSCSRSREPRAAAPFHATTDAGDGAVAVFFSRGSRRLARGWRGLRVGRGPRVWSTARLTRASPWRSAGGRPSRQRAPRLCLSLLPQGSRRSVDRALLRTGRVRGLVRAADWFHTLKIDQAPADVGALGVRRLYDHLRSSRGRG